MLNPKKDVKLGTLLRRRASRRRSVPLLLIANIPIMCGILVFLALAFAAGTALGAPVDVRCARMTEPARGELTARARLLLLGARMESAQIAVVCDASAAWLVWVDGGKTRVDEGSGLVEGSLDAIEARLGGATRVHPSPPPAPADHAAPPAPPVAARTLAVSPPILTPPPAPGDDAGQDVKPSKRSTVKDLEGGVSLASKWEIWSHSVLAGPQLEVGLAVGRKFAVVVGEGARFALGGGDAGQVIVFDLQAGVAWGAPYQQGSGFGIVLLGGAERLAVSAGRFGESGAWAWSATGMLGARGSLALDSFDAWIGVDGIVRSTTIETGQPGSLAIPSLAAVVSFGFFLPAFGRPTSAPASSGTVASTP